MQKPFDPAGLASQIGQTQGIPPLEKWNPTFCGDIDMRIARDGSWYYQGSIIGREAMVRLFSRVLWREGDQYFLKTPVEKVGIQVEDVPFSVILMERQPDADRGETLVFTTSTGDRIEAGAEHPIRVATDTETGEPSPYLLIRFGMEGRLSRNLFYELVEMAATELAPDGDELVVYSAGQRFVLGKL
ncbi:DUF1285 domain-containing protein [Nitrincola sp. MINF-07-Sa-05]|uniref:DUF1285 domain-containing protein n=1 Tax=Nitrincola salilacus TaxID=3400273 RepID=UPI00391833AE